jgi:hypothetical protein
MNDVRSIEDRAHDVGLSLARLGRLSSVPVWRLYQGIALRGDELLRLDATLDRYKHRRRSAATVDTSLVSYRSSQSS